MRQFIIGGKDHNQQTEQNNSKLSDFEKTVIAKKVKSSSYMKIYNDDSDNMKQIKKEWNKRIDSIKRD